MFKQIASGAAAILGFPAAKSVEAVNETVPNGIHIVSSSGHKIELIGDVVADVPIPSVIKVEIPEMPKIKPITLPNITFEETPVTFNTPTPEGVFVECKDKISVSGPLGHSNANGDSWPNLVNPYVPTSPRDKKLVEVEKELLEVDKKLSRMTDERQLLKELFEKEEKEHVALKTRSNALQRNYDDVNKGHADLASRLAGKDEELKALTTIRDNLTKKTAELTTTIASLKANDMLRVKAIGTKDIRITELFSEVAELQKALDIRLQSLQNVEKVRDQLQKDIKELKKAADLKTGCNNEVQRSLQNVERVRDELQKGIQNKDARIKELEDEQVALRHDAKENRSDLLSDQIVDMTAKLDKAKVENKQTKDGLANTILDLQGKVKTRTEERDLYLKENKELRDKILATTNSVGVGAQEEELKALAKSSEKQAQFLSDLSKICGGTQK